MLYMLEVPEHGQRLIDLWIEKEPPSLDTQLPEKAKTRIALGVAILLDMKPGHQCAVGVIAWGGSFENTARTVYIIGILPFTPEYEETARRLRMFRPDHKFNGSLAIFLPSGLTVINIEEIAKTAGQ